MKKRTQRLGPSQETRDKISAALSLVPKTPEHAAAAGLAKRGKPCSEETKRKISQTKKYRNHRRAIGAVKDATYERGDTRKDALRRAARQMYVDLEVAGREGMTELYKDVLKSKGFRAHRRVFDPTGKISDGYSSGRVWWPLKEKTDGVP